MLNVITSVTAWLQLLYDTSLFVYLFCVCLKACALGDVNSWTHTCAWFNELLFGIIEYCHILHMYSIQDMLIARSLIGKKKTTESENVAVRAVVLRDTQLSPLCRVNLLIGNLIWIPRGKNETVSGWHCACELASDGIHTVRYAVLSFFCWILFFHTVPSLQQNIHIKTLADDMVRCLV